MVARHPFVLSAWAVLVMLTGVSLSNPPWFAVVVLVAPFVALATLGAVQQRTSHEPLRPGWAIAYRGATALLAACALAGIIAAAGHMVTFGAHRHLENGPLALLFLVTLVVTWPAVTRPTPRRAAVPAVVVHFAWMPLVILNALAHHRDFVMDEWSALIVVGAGIGILALSVVVAILSLVAFAGPSALARATACR